MPTKIASDENVIPLPELELGKMLLGRYEIIKNIAAGGQGRVYLAYDTVLDSEKKTKLVIKQLQKRSDGARERFRREVSILRELGDSGAENIVRTYEYQQEEKDGDTFEYIVMEYVDGMTLADLIEKQGSIPVPLALYIFEQIGMGLAAAHEKGIIHRDIKPENVLISWKGVVKLTDFGLAGTENDFDAEGLSSSGTLRFKSPEQIEDSSSVDESSDIYSMGCMLYKMLFNECPFDDDDPDEKNRRRNIETKILEGKYVLPIERDPSIPRELNDFIVKMMERSRIKRAFHEVGDFQIEAVMRRERAIDLSYGLDFAQLRYQLECLMTGRNAIQNFTLHLELRIPSECFGEMPVITVYEDGYGGYSHDQVEILQDGEYNQEDFKTYVGTKCLSPERSYTVKIALGPCVFWKAVNLSHGHDEKIILGPDCFRHRKIPLTIQAHAFDAESGAALSDAVFEVQKHGQFLSDDSDWIPLSEAELFTVDKISIRATKEGYKTDERALYDMKFYEDTISVEFPLVQVVDVDKDFYISDGILKKYCASASSVTIPDGVKEIGDRAFRNCTSLVSVTIPDSVTEIGRNAFTGCSSLASVSISEGVKRIGEYAFSRCTSLNSVSIPAGVTAIGEGAFSSCTSLAFVRIPGSVKEIGHYAFRNCTALASMTIPDGVMEIGNHAFNGCASLASVSIPDSVTEIGGRAFRDCNISELSHPCLTIHDGFAIKDGTLLYRASQASDITIPKEVTKIGDSAFSDCTSLVSVCIPLSVKRIGEDAFGDCTSLASVSISEGVKRIGNRAFDGCTSLVSVSIPDSVREVGCHVFAHCTSLTSVNIPNSVMEIEDGAFSRCTSLVSVTIPDGVMEIGNHAFIGCTSLASVSIPNSVMEIGDGAFFGCTSLASVSIPESVKRIGEGAFGGCTSLEEIRFGGTKAQWKAVGKEEDWSGRRVPAKFVTCTDGEAEL